jgi:hypothetical protein
MSSDRRKESSRANGAKSHGPTTPEGKKRSSRNAVQHGLLARCLLFSGEDAANFQILIQNHDRRFQPADGIEFGMIEEMCAAYWRLHRVWTIETHTLEHQFAIQPPGDEFVRLINASHELAALPGTALMQRYETRLQNMYARAIRTFKILKTIPLPDQDDDFSDQDNPPNIQLPNEPSPIPEHPSPAVPDAPAAPPSSLQPTDPEALGSACFSLLGSVVAAAPVATDIPAAPPPKVKKSGGAV